MNRYEKKRLLESDIDALIEDFLQVRLEQTTTKDDAKIVELNSRADQILATINSKGNDISRLFPERPLHEVLCSFYTPDSPEPGGMDVFKKRAMLQRQLESLPEFLPAKIRQELEQEITSMEDMIRVLRSVPSAGYSANRIGCN